MRVLFIIVCRVISLFLCFLFNVVMPSMCCVVYCKSGYRSNPEKVSCFLFPKDEELKSKWIKAIPRSNLKVSPKTFICEKHFTAGQIIRTWESGTGANKIVINLKRPRLTSEAIPSIFPGPKYLSKLTKNRKPPTKRVLYSSINQANEVNNENSCIQSHLVPTETAISSLQPEYQPGVIFSQIFKNPAVVLCPSGWQYKVINEKNPFITYYFAISCIDIDGTFGLLLEKQISFGKDMVMMCKLYNKMFDLEKIGIEIPCLPSVQNITIILQQLNNIHVCIGGPLEHQYPGIHNSMALVGLNGRWRHKQCPYILDYKIRQKQSCLHCFNISGALRMKRKRMSEGTKNQEWKNSQ